MLDWMREVYPGLQTGEAPLECIQKPGDVIYVPKYWYHATINLAESTAVTGGPPAQVAASAVGKHEASALLELVFRLHRDPRRDNKELVRNLKRLIKMEPRNLFHKVMLAQVFTQLDNRDAAKAIKLLQHVSKKDPFFVEPQYLLARLFGGGEEARAIGRYVRYLEANPRSLMANHALYLYYQALGEYEKAVEYVQRNADLQHPSLQHCARTGEDYGQLSQDLRRSLREQL